MKTCTRFHIEDVEPGDVIILYRRYENDESVTIAVKRTFKTNRFNWGIETTDADTFYWDDWDWAEAVLG